MVKSDTMMNFHDCIYFLGLPSTLSILSLILPEKYYNVHYTCIGVWIGVFLKFYFEADLIGLSIIPFSMFIYHLYSILKQEYQPIKKYIKTKFSKNANSKGNGDGGGKG